VIFANLRRRRLLAHARAAIDRGELVRAKGLCQEAIGAQAPHGPAATLLGKIHLKLGEMDEALRVLNSAIASDERDAAAHNLLGMALRDRGKAADAESHFRRAIVLEPSIADAHINLGAVLNEQGRAAEAQACLRRAVAEDPTSAIGWCNLGLVLAEQGNPDEADRCFGAALAADPDYFYARLTRVMNKLREVYDSEADLLRCRGEYEKALKDLATRIPRSDRSIAGAADAVGWVTPFFLAYQGGNDRELQRTYGALVCEVMARRYRDLAAPPALPPATERLRVGIASGFFFDHSVWKNPIRGWIEHLDRSGFELFGYYTGTREDGDTATARRACSQFVEGLPFEALARRIREDRLHVLIFPEIGMDPMTVKLAALRLAPVQCTSWGHPTTSGLPTVDYFLSSERMEPLEGDAQYTERLVRLPKLSVHYTPPAYPPRVLERSVLGLRPGAAAFFCAQSLFKYLPQHDELFPRIARQLEDCQFVFIASQRSPALTERFRRRVAGAFEAMGLEAGRHMVILPRMDGSTFQAVARCCDVFLDNPGWSGCNSALESMAGGLVPVACAGSTMRARHVFAFLQLLELEELISDDLPGYVELAARLGRDAGWRNEVRGRMMERLPRLFGDLSCIRALENFLKTASASAHRPAPSARA
jgi:protein O-GlcNAc transferase